MRKLESFGLTLEEPTTMSSQQVQYDSAEKESDVDADGHYETRVAVSRT